MEATGAVKAELEVTFFTIYNGVRTGLRKDRVLLIEGYSGLEDVERILKISTGADKIELDNIKFLP